MVWVGFALAVMLTAVALSLSRGGILALLGGALVCLGLRFSMSVPVTRLAAVLVIPGLSLALLGWFGFNALERRLATIWKGEVLQDGRAALWATCWPLVREFPVWGTGLGTFPYVEPLHRTADADRNMLNEHAHNDYLEALVEGGIPRLASESGGHRPGLCPCR